MEDSKNYVFGDGGPLIVLQASAVSEWQGADDWDNSLMNGGTVRTGYDAICDDDLLNGGCVLSHRNHDMLVLWDAESGARVLDPAILSLPPSSIVIIDNLADSEGQIFVAEFEKLLARLPYSSQQMTVLDESLRLQVGAESIPSEEYGFIDIPVSPGLKQIDYYVGKQEEFGELVIIRNIA